MKLRNRPDRPDVVVIDDFLTKRDFRELKTYMEGSCVWGPRLDLSKEQERDHKLNYGFSTPILDHDYDDQWYDYDPEIDIIKRYTNRIVHQYNFTELFAVRMDMTTYRGEEQITLSPHVDRRGPHYTSILHMTTCDAPTIIYNEMSDGYDDFDIPPDEELTIKKVIEAKENRLILFVGNYIHTGRCPTDVPIRTLINANYRYA